MHHQSSFWLLNLSSAILIIVELFLLERQIESLVEVTGESVYGSLLRKGEIDTK